MTPDDPAPVTSGLSKFERWAWLVAGLVVVIMVIVGLILHLRQTPEPGRSAAHPSSSEYV